MKNLWSKFKNSSHFVPVIITSSIVLFMFFAFIYPVILILPFIALVYSMMWSIWNA